MCALYLNNALHYASPSWMNKAANFALTPVRCVFDGRTYQIIDGKAHQDHQFDATGWEKLAVVITLFIPSLIVGTVLRILSLMNTELREGFKLIGEVSKSPSREPEGTSDRGLPAPPPAKVAAAPLLTFHLDPTACQQQVSKCLNFFNSFVGVKERKASKFLETQTQALGFNPFHLCAHLQRDKATLEARMRAGSFGKLSETYKNAVAKVTKLNLAEQYLPPATA